MKQALLALILLAVAVASEDPNVQPLQNLKIEIKTETAKPETPPKTILKTTLDCIQLAQEAGNLVQEGKYEASFLKLHAYDPAGRFIQSDQITVLTTNIRAANEGMERSEFGSKITGGFEYIGALKTGESVLAVYFWSKHQYTAMPWRMLFYKARDEWNFIDCNFGPELTADLIFLAKKEDVKLVADKPVNNK